MEWHHARRMGTIDQRLDAALGELPDECPNWQHESRLAGDVIQQRQSGPWRNPAQHRVHDFLLRPQRKWNIRHDHTRPGSLGNKVQRIAARVVLMVRDQEFITAFESQRTQHGVDTRGRIRHEHQALRVSSEEFRQRTASIIE